MIPAGVQIFVALEPVDMRCGFERLSGLARERIGYEARCGALFVFFGKRRETVKIVFFDGTGICLFYKRLDRSTFALPDAPAPGASHLEIDDATLEALLDGMAIHPNAKTKRSAPRRLHLPFLTRRKKQLDTVRSVRVKRVCANRRTRIDA